MRCEKAGCDAYGIQVELFGGIVPAELCLVAAHHSDLAAARACGLATAYVDRPHEYGGRPAPDRHLRQDWDYDTISLEDLADHLGC